MTQIAKATQPYFLADDAGSPFWFIGTLVVHKAAARDTRGAFDLVDQWLPAGFAPPRHIHRREDEAFYVLEGDATFWYGENELRAERGGFIYLPRGIEHALKVGHGGARLLTLTLPSGFAEFVAEAGEPARQRSIPAPGAVDTGRLAEIAARYGIEITGPPPE
jgi:quercetin dioxygenase-like cupin family protein